MTRTTTSRTAVARRGGYVVGALINAALLVLINVAPGWSAVPFLTGDMNKVLVWVDITILAGLLTNVGYTIRDSRRLVAGGGVLTAGLGLATLVRFWQVFPFDFGHSAVDWASLVRIALLVGLVGTAVAIVAQLGVAVRGDPSSPPARE